MLLLLSSIHKLPYLSSSLLPLSFYSPPACPTPPFPSDHSLRVSEPIIAPQPPHRPPLSTPHTPAPALSHPFTDGWLGSVVQLWSSSLRAPQTPPPHPHPSASLPPNFSSHSSSSSSPPSSDENNVSNSKLGSQLRKLTPPQTHLSAHLPRHSLLTLSFPAGPWSRLGSRGPHKSRGWSGEASSQAPLRVEWLKVGHFLSLL